MRKDEVDSIVRRKPFRAFEVRLVDGGVFQFSSPEQLIVSRGSIYTLDENQDGMFIDLGMIATIRIFDGNGH